MLEKCRNAQERWGGVNELVDHWLDDRQKLIARFVAMPNVEIRQLEQELSTFCIGLMDYLSSGHFEVYEQLLRVGGEICENSLEKAQDIFPRIQPTTDAALDFNDNYGQFTHPTVQEIRELSFQLSILGEKLEERFSLEDQLIELLHTAHKDRVMGQ